MGGTARALRAVQVIVLHWMGRVWGGRRWDVDEGHTSSFKGGGSKLVAGGDAALPGEFSATMRAEFPSACRGNCHVVQAPWGGAGALAH